jgi:outer membrane protein TolC
MKKNLFISLICVLFSWGFAFEAFADTLTLSQAIEKTLGYNHGLKVARIQSEMAENLATPGNAGLLPKVSLTAGTTYSNQNTTIVFNGNIPKNEVEGAISKGYNTSLGMSYTLFDGLGVVYNYKKLQTQSDRSQMQWLLTTENTVIQVINLYLEVLKIQNALEILQSNLKISEERLLRVERAFEIGSRTGLDRLNARVDFTNDSLTLATTSFQLNNLKRNLNWIMGQEIQTDYIVRMPQTELLHENLEAILTKSLGNNRNFILAGLNKEIAELDYSLAFSKRMPVLTGNVAYGINHAENGAGIVLSSDVAGFSGGLGLNFNLFDGMKIKTSIENAELAISVSEEQKKETSKSISREALNAFEGYRFSVQQKEMEHQHVLLAKLALERSVEAYRNGSITSTDLRIAQQNLLNAQTRQFNSGLAVLKYYYELRKLSGALVAE